MTCAEPASVTATALLAAPVSVSSCAPPVGSLVMSAKRYSTAPGSVSNVTCHLSAPTRVIVTARLRSHDPSALAAPVSAKPCPSRTGHETPSVIVVVSKLMPSKAPPAGDRESLAMFSRSASSSRRAISRKSS